MKVETALPLGKVDPGLRAPAARLELAEVPEAARQVEELGYDGLVTTETKDDPFLVLGLAATTTHRISLTTAVAIAFPRSPMVTALTAWSLQRLSRGRFILGLGTQVKGHIERRYSVPWAPPTPRLREYILALRSIWDCWQYERPLNFQGEFYRFSLMVPLFNPGPIEHPYIPVHVAAINRHNCRLAGEVCDGLRPHPITTRKYIAEVMLPEVERGARRAGRSPAEVEVCVSPLIVSGATDQELSQRAEDVRARIAFYASTRTYSPVFELHGWGEMVSELHRLSRAGRWEEMPRHISDEVLETIAVVAKYDDIAAAVRQRYGDLAQRVEFSLPAATEEERQRLARVVAQIKGAGAPAR